jgi:hypothetical protein
MNAFVKMRQLAGIYAQLTQQVDQLEIVQRSFEIKTNTRFDRIFETIGSNNVIPSEGIFYDGQIFDAYAFVANIIKSAKKSIILIDNYIDETVLMILSKRRPQVSAAIYTKSISKRLQLDLKKHHEQYPSIEVRTFDKSHDRFLIVDESTIYHIGASLKDIGKKWFAFSKINLNAPELIEKLTS